MRPGFLWRWAMSTWPWEGCAPGCGGRRRAATDRDFAEGGIAGSLARGGKRIDSDHADAHALEPAAGGGGAADQLQGFTLQTEADWV